MTGSNTHYVEIVAFDPEPGEDPVRMGPMTERQARQTRAGAEINLNHDRYFTRIVTESAANAT